MLKLFWPFSPKILLLPLKSTSKYHFCSVAYQIFHRISFVVSEVKTLCFDDFWPFSDLQFALAHQTASAETEAELRSLVVGLQGDSDLNKDLVLSLQVELEKSQRKVGELEEQLRWQELEKQNQLNVKEAKIQELKKFLNTHDGKVLIVF